MTTIVTAPPTYRSGSIPPSFGPSVTAYSARSTGTLLTPFSGRHRFHSEQGFKQLDMRALQSGHTPCSCAKSFGCLPQGLWTENQQFGICGRR
jgi:hypothetical protein